MPAGAHTVQAIKDSTRRIRSLSYTLERVIASASVLHAASEYDHARVVALAQGLCLLPMIDEFFDEARHPAGTRGEGRAELH